MKGSILSSHPIHLVLIGCFILGLNLSSVSAQRLYWLGVLNNGSGSYAHGVSNNGVVVGSFIDRPTIFNRGGAFRWTATGGMQDLGPLGANQEARAHDISADGSIIVGVALDSQRRNRAFRWTSGGGMQMLPGPRFQSSGTSDNISCEANDISAGGSVIVGSAIVQNDACGGTGGRIKRLGVRWDGSEPFGYHFLDLTPNRPCYATYAYGVSADGSVVVGTGMIDVGDNWTMNAFRWTAATGIMQILGPPNSYAYDVSADGGVVVGKVANVTGGAFRWTEANNVQFLGDDTHDAQSVSGDGSVIVGTGCHQNGCFPFRWTAATGRQDLNQLCVGQLRRGSRLVSTPFSYTHRYVAISPNARYIVGQGFNSRTNRVEAYLIDMELPPPPRGDVNGDGCVNDVDLLLVLFHFGSNDWDADLNGSRWVDDQDLLLVLFTFGDGC